MFMRATQYCFAQIEGVAISATPAMVFGQERRHSWAFADIQRAVCSGILALKKFFQRTVQGMANAP
jgi:hypothetical protein